MAQTATAEVLNPVRDRERTYPRRFELPDLSQHGGWILNRLAKVYRHLNEQQMAGWLRGIVYSNEFLFLYMPHSVALCQVERGHTLIPAPVVREHFVWAMDPANPAHVDEAAEFYTNIMRWARQQSAGTIIVENNSDVPHETVVKKCEKRVFTREEKFVRL
jgi:hypothetical protein